jgi:hypothetical protein
MVVAATTGRKVSRENGAGRQSNFTPAIVEGLSGNADLNKDGSAYLTEFDTDVTDRVEAPTNGRQQPATARPAITRSFPLSRP